jgi:hypothetical protein
VEDILATSYVARIMNRPIKRETAMLFRADHTGLRTGIAIKGVKLCQIGTAA